MKQKHYKTSMLYGVGMVSITATALENGISFDDNDNQISPFLNGGIDFSFVDRR